MTMSKCPGCGGLFDDIPGPTHRYLESSPGCWAVYGEVLAREYSDPKYYAVHRLSVDAYAVQHPGRPAPQTIQSVAVHLISLCLVLELGVNIKRATLAMKSAVEHKDSYAWLTPPESMGSVTVADVHQAKDAKEHIRLVRTWATSAWTAWSLHRATIESWLPRKY